MKFLIDAQLPRRFAVWLTETGHDALHTLDMPLKNQTPDQEVVARAGKQLAKTIGDRPRFQGE